MTEPRKTNKIFSQKPKLANIIPADLALPMIGCGAVGLLSYGWFGLHPLLCLGATFWTGSTYWMFVGDKPYLHLAKITEKTPNWASAQTKYELRHGDIPSYIARNEEDNDEENQA